MKKAAKIVAILMVAVMLMISFTACGMKMSTSEARKGTVRIIAIHTGTLYISNDLADWDPYGEFRVVTCGSGFGVGKKVDKDTDTFVTNRHVVEPYSDIVRYSGAYVLYETETTTTYILNDDYAYSEAMGFDSSRMTPCDILYMGKEDDADLAVVKTPAPMDGRVALALLGEKSEIDAGDSVYALGYPGSSDDYVTDLYSGQKFLGSVESATVTNGIVSLHTTFNNGTSNVRIIQHTANVNHGNSGGPLIDDNGTVVGVNTWIWGTDTTTGDLGTNGSIEISYVRDILDKLHVDYVVYSGGIPAYVLWIIIAAVIIAIIVIVIVVVLNSKKAPKPADDGHVNPGPIPGPVNPGDTGLRVQGVSGIHHGRRYAVMAGKPMVFGRGPGSVIRYPDGTPGVSGTHCTMWAEGGKMFIKDNGSTHGTFVNQNKIAPNQTIQLNIGDSIALGSQNEKFVIASKGGV